jgi:hypothetical protein
MRSTVMAMCGMLLWSVSASATTYLVRPDGTGDFPTIQAAIHAATSGDTITLADGVFTGTGNRDITFLGKAIVLRSQSGDPAGCVIDAQASANDEHRIFSFVDAEGPNTVLDGVTVRGGWKGTGVPARAPGREAPLSCELPETSRTADSQSRGGGGIYCGPGTGPTIRDCVIEGNVADYGGGMAVSSNGYPTIVGCVFANNFAPGDGGGIGYEFRPDSTHMTVSHCLFQANATWYHGGGVAVQGQNLLSDCTFTGNQSGFGGGFFDCGERSGTEFLRCTFVHNAAVAFDGGVGGGGAT